MPSWYSCRVRTASGNLQEYHEGIVVAPEEGLR